MKWFTYVLVYVLLSCCTARRVEGRLSVRGMSDGAMSKSTIDSSQSNTSQSPFDLDGDPVEWLVDKFQGMVTTVRTTLGDDDAPMDKIKVAATAIVKSLGGDIGEYMRAIKLCSWLQAVPESAAQPIRQPVPDNLDLGITFKARSKDGYIGRYELYAASVKEGSIAQSLGIVAGMHPRSVRGQATAFVSANKAHHGDMTKEQFYAALKGAGEAFVVWDPPDYEQRRIAAVRRCMLDISSVCSHDTVRPLQVTASRINYREDHCGGCDFFCAEKPESKYEPDDVEEWSSLLVPGQAVDVRVPLEVKDIEIADGAPEGMELSGNVIQVDSASSRKHCLFTGMTLVELNGQRLDAERPLEQLDGNWKYDSGELFVSNTGEYFVHRRMGNRTGEYEYHFYEKLKSGIVKEGLLVETEMENGRWWLADLPRGQQIRLRREGIHMISQLRQSSKGSFQSRIRATLASPRERLETDRGKKLSLRVRPIGVQDVKAVVRTVRTSGSKYCRQGQAEVQFYLDKKNQKAWFNAFTRAGAVPISFPALNTRRNFQCDNFIADSFTEVVDAAKDVAKEDLKWGSLQVSISVTAGVTAIIFPPILGLHGAAAVGAGIGIKSVGTAMKAGAHGAERVSHGQNFNGSAVALELGIGVGLNAVSVAGGHEIGHLLGHHVWHDAAGEMASGNVAETVIEQVGEHAVEKALHKKHSENVGAGTLETISEHCMQVLFER